jgi:hypothetical protein
MIYQGYVHCGSGSDGDTLYLYTGHDEAKGKELFTM